VAIYDGGVAVVGVAILIPTLWRSHRLDALIDNINEATPESHRIYFMCPKDDTATIEVLTRREETFWTDEGDMTYATRINKLFHLTTAPWIFTGSDDILFHPGWLTACLRYRAYDVISPWDGLNSFGTNFLIRRSYIEQRSGCLDIPDVVFAPYGHFFCDTELRQVATRRGVFINARDAVVEHLHWANGKNENDAVYDLGLSRFDADEALFHNREYLWEWRDDDLLV